MGGISDGVLQNTNVYLDTTNRTGDSTPRTRGTLRIVLIKNVSDPNLSSWTTMSFILNHSHMNMIKMFTLKTDSKDQTHYKLFS